MNKESLITARDLIIEALDDDRIDLQDATELMINIYSLLDPKEYEDNINTLQLRRYLCIRK